MEVTPTGGVRIRISWMLCLLLLPFIVAYMAASIWLCVMSINAAFEMRLQVIAVGVAGTCLGGAFGLFIIWLMSSAKRLVIDDNGFVDQVNWVGNGRVQWRDVRGTRLVSVLGFKILVIDMHDSQKFVRRGNIVQRSLKALHKWLYGSSVTVPLFGWEVRARDVKAIFDRFFDRSVGRVTR